MSRLFFHKTIERRKKFKADGNHIIAANIVFHIMGIMISNENIYLTGLCNRENFNRKIIN